ncbi:MAG: hypothetical protein ACLTTW_06800 [Coprobacter sp.]
MAICAGNTKDELKETDAYAKSRSVELIPCVQVLAHIKEFFDTGNIKK